MSKAAVLVVCFLCLCMPHPLCAGQGVAIELVSFGEVDPAALVYLKERLGQVFDAQVTIGRTFALPEYAFNRKRRQYHSKAILDTLAKLQNVSSRQKVLAVINKDLYVPGLNFVFGQADPPKGISIISLIRLHQGFYGLPEDETLFLERTLKEAVHELGHLFGLGHCANPGCVMHFSNSLRDTDKKSAQFCAGCRQRLF